MSSPRIVISIPSRGRTEHLPALLGKLASTKSEATTVVVASNGPQKFADPGLPGIHVVHIGDIPTIPVAVNFAWYGLRTDDSILVKLDNDINPPAEWESEILNWCRVADLGGFLNANETVPTPLVEMRGRMMRQGHISHTWGMPFLWGAFVWLAPSLAEAFGYEDERFVCSDDGDLGERASRLPGATVAYCPERMLFHLKPGAEGSTVSAGLLQEMYEACDQLIKALPPRPILQPTIWADCLSRDEARAIILDRGHLPEAIERRAREALRARLAEAFALIGREALVERIFNEI